MSVIRHAQCINDNLVIKVDYKSKFPYIFGHSVELLRQFCHDLDVPGISKMSNILDEAVAASGGFLCLLSSLQINTQITSTPHFLSICCICVFLYLYLFLVLVSLQLKPCMFLVQIIFHHLFNNKSALFSIMRRFSFIMGISYTQMSNW